MKKNDTKNMDLEGFTLSLALVDSLPVIFFGISFLALSEMFGSIIFTIGAVLCFLGGLSKVLWKIIIALSKKNVYILNKFFKIFMPVGFMLMMAALVIDRSKLNFAAMGKAVTSIPSAIFFVLGIGGMCLMGYWAKKLDSTSAKANWIEQLTNAFAQGMILLGILFL